MNATEFFEKLTILDACPAAIEWAEGKDLATAWRSCERGDWMLWLAVKCGVELRPLTAAKAACAEFARSYITDLRSIAALDTAHAFGRGECGADELAAAADVAYTAASAAANAAANAAYYAAAADSAAAAADSAADAAYYTAAADADAYYTAAAAADAACTANIARAETLRKCADEVRKHITIEILL